MFVIASYLYCLLLISFLSITVYYIVYLNNNCTHSVYTFSFEHITLVP